MAASAPPAALVRSAWRPYLQDYLVRLVPAIPDGVSLTSWFRDAQHNARVGGHPESQHLFALSTDWAGPRVALDTMEYYAALRGLVPVRKSGMLHVQMFPAGALRRAGVIFPT